ncbi:MAG: aquaporin family protein [Methanomassiliicoccaceae archaeon]|jgi:glycerol uptake facilitator-like aquaporin|nr:aquaporin family protein [Methanomassiliicoccaceae archaeon]
MDKSYVSSRGVAAEFLGTMALIVVVIGSVILSQHVWGSALPYEFVFINAIAVGFVLFALIETFSPLSGAHFNPAVTISLTVAGECSKKKAAYYICAQLAGALAGVLLVNVFFYDTVQGLFFVSDIDRSSIYLIISEFFCAFMLVGVIFGCVRGGSNKTSLAVGLFVGGMILATSSTMFANPAVNIARIFTDAACGIAPLSALYFTLADIAGAVAAALVFGWLYPKKLKKGEKCDAFDCSTKDGPCCDKSERTVIKIE